jgi:probable HAF family extracellular repeat protein
MNRTIRKVCSTIVKVIVLYACSLTLPVDTSSAIGVFDHQEACDGKNQRRHHDKLTFNPIDFPGATATAAVGINDHGQIVGFFMDIGSQIHGFLLDDGVFTRIDFPGAAQTAAVGINNRGQIVGEVAFVSGGPSSSFLLDDGVFTRIDAPCALATRAFGINDRGQIVGVFFDSVGVGHGFLAQ